MSIAINSNNLFMRPQMDPDAYAKQYATQKGISLEEAKAELKAQFGDPKEGANVPYIGQSTETSSIGSQNSNNGYVGLGFNENDSVDNSSGMYGMSPDAYAEMYAYQNGITIEEAKEELKKKHGDPQQRLNLIA